MTLLTFIPLFVSMQELLIIAAIALLLFGGKKLPELMRGLGQGISEFKKAANDVSQPVQDAGKETGDAVKSAQDSTSK